MQRELFTRLRLFFPVENGWFKIDDFRMLADWCNWSSIEGADLIFLVPPKFSDFVSILSLVLKLWYVYLASTNKLRVKMDLHFTRDFWVGLHSVWIKFVWKSHRSLQKRPSKFLSLFLLSAIVDMEWLKIFPSLFTTKCIYSVEIRCAQKGHDYAWPHVGKVCIRANVAHQAKAYPGFCGMKRLGVFLLPLDGC